MKWDRPVTTCFSTPVKELPEKLQISEHRRNFSCIRTKCVNCDFCAMGSLSTIKFVTCFPVNNVLSFIWCYILNIPLKYLCIGIFLLFIFIYFSCSTRTKSIFCNIRKGCLVLVLYVYLAESRKQGHPLQVLLKAQQWNLLADHTIWSSDLLITSIAASSTKPHTTTNRNCLSFIGKAIKWWNTECMFSVVIARLWTWKMCLICVIILHILPLKAINC